MALIGISGKMGSGKDLTGEIIQYLICKKNNYLDPSDNSFREFTKTPISNRLQSKYTIKKYADKLKDIVCLLIGCTREQLEDREFKEKELGEEWWYWEVYETENSSKRLSNYLDKESFNGFYDATLVIPTPRLILQLLGTECGREIIHPNIWTNALFADYNCINCGETPCTESHNNVKGGSRKLPNWIITDVRFPNELQAIKDRKGITIRLNRDYVLSGNPEDPKKQHESETALDNAKFDYVIENNGSIEDLIEKVESVLLKEEII